MTRGDRLIVPYQPDVQEQRKRAVEASLPLTDPVSAVLTATRAPTSVGTVAAKLLAESLRPGPRRWRS